jgi:hypothetical protein
LLRADTCVFAGFRHLVQHRIRQHTSAYVRIRPHTSEYVIVRQNTSANVSILPASSTALDTSSSTAYVSIRQHTSAYVSIRKHTSAYVSIRQHTTCVFDSLRNLVKHRIQLLLPFRRSLCREGVSICTFVLVKQVNSAPTSIPTLSLPRRCQYLYFCTGKASKLSSCFHSDALSAAQVSVFVLLYW